MTTRKKTNAKDASPCPRASGSRVRVTRLENVGENSSLLRSPDRIFPRLPQPGFSLAHAHII